MVALHGMGCDVVSLSLSSNFLLFSSPFSVHSPFLCSFPFFFCSLAVLVSFGFRLVFVRFLCCFCFVFVWFLFGFCLVSMCCLFGFCLGFCLLFFWFHLVVFGFCLVLFWFLVWFLFGCVLFRLSFRFVLFLLILLASSLTSFCSCSVLFLIFFCFFFGSLPSSPPVLFRLSFRLLFTSSVFYLPSFLLRFVYFWFLPLRLTKINKISKQTSKHKFKVHENIYILVVLFCCIQHKHRTLRRKLGPTAG